MVSLSKEFLSVLVSIFQVVQPAFRCLAQAARGEDRFLPAQERFGIGCELSPDLQISGVQVLWTVDKGLEAVRNGCIAPIADNENQPGVRINFGQQAHGLAVQQTVRTFVAHHAAWGMFAGLARLAP